MAKINCETLLRGDYLLFHICITELENLAFFNHLQLSLFVPLPLLAPGSAPDMEDHKQQQGGRDKESLYKT